MIQATNPREFIALLRGLRAIRQFRPGAMPQERLVRTVISLGYLDEEARRARPRVANARKPLSELVLWERY